MMLNQTFLKLVILYPQHPLDQSSAAPHNSVILNQEYERLKNWVTISKRAVLECLTTILIAITKQKD
jgi:hypothetical protein